MIDLYYWFENSTKRKNGLQSYCAFCNQDHQAIVKHVSTHWLSLEIAVQRCLKHFPSLTSYFRSECESQARFKRLQRVFNDPMTKVYLLFFQSVLPTFTYCNQFLQREQPLIHVLQPQFAKLLQSILEKYVKPVVLAESLKTNSLSSVDFRNSVNLVDDDCLVIGFMTKQTIKKCLDEGDVSTHQYSLFFKAVKAFLTRAIEYLLLWCPLNDKLLAHATWLDFEHRLEKNFLSVQYFVLQYPKIFPEMNMDHLNEQLMNYQLLKEDDITTIVKESVGLGPDDPHQVDVFWGYLKGVRKPGSSTFEFDLLFKVAELVMTIPHSNAGEEYSC